MNDSVKIYKQPLFSKVITKKIDDTPKEQFIESQLNTFEKKIQF